MRALILLVGVDDEAQRKRLLRLGFGDVLGSDASLDEIEARAQSIAARSETLPRIRTFGRLSLDLLARDGFVAGRPLGLHPREFALIWRLADTPGKAVEKQALVSDVWRMAHVPDTNSLAVHIFRLRAKLAIFGLADLIQTAPSGGYWLMPTSAPANTARFMLAETVGQDDAAMAL